MKTLVVLYEGFDATHLAILQYIKPQADVLYASLRGLEIGGYNISLSLEDAARTTELDVLFVPGGDPVPNHVPNIVEALKKLAATAHHTIGIESGLTLLAHTGLLNKNTVAVRSEVLSELQAQFPQVTWVDKELFRSAQFWSGKGSPEALKSLGLIFSLALKHPISDPYPGPPEVVLKQDHQEDVLHSSKTPTPGQICANSVRNSRTEAEAIEVACCFAARLAAEGMLPSANELILSICAALPGSISGMNYIVRAGFEFLWDRAGERPDVPWGAPSAEDLDKQDHSLRGKYPKSIEEKKETLEALEAMIALGDLQPRPYSLWHATALALELDQEERARHYMSLLAQLVLQINLPMTWVSVIQWRILSGLILEGIIGHVTGQTSEGAWNEANEVIEAIRSFPGIHANNAAQQALRRKQITDLSFHQLLGELNPLKDESGEPLHRPPALSADISAAEARLGIALPDDFKTFLGVSNGLGFCPSLERPGIRAVETLNWEEPAVYGLDDVIVDLGLQLNPSEEEKIPKLGRLIILSHGDDEDNVWLVEPSQVENALEAVRTERQENALTQGIGWRTVYGAHYLPELEWYGSFREYLDTVVLGMDDAILGSM